MVPCVAGVVLALGAMTVHGQPRDLSREDPAKIVSAETCGECHLSTFAVWKGTPHARGFKTLHRKAAAAAIADSLGLRLVKRDSICLRCHYTPTVDDDQLKAAAGVTCESCHGAGRDWIDVHNDYGAGADRASESAEHRRLRVERSGAAGMRRPSDGLYALASSCFGCHTVPEERLVNVGGHGTGSAGFELVEWSQGEIRHNFLDSFLNGDGSVNAERSSPRLRMMYVLGRALDLEHSLRGMAAATAAGLYGKAMSRRVRSAVGEVRAISRALPLPEIDGMLATVRGVEVVPSNRDALLAAALAVGAATRQFLANHDGSRLAAIDPLRRGEDIAFDDPEPAGEPGDPTVVSSVASSVVSSASGADGGRAAATEASTVSSSVPSSQRGGGGTAAVPAVGKFTRKVRAASAFDTVGPGVCSGCHRHQKQATWWYDDAHYAAADRFFEGAPAAIQIARLYGIKAADITKGNQVCMDCHGSVVSGKEQREAQDGVGCESCHGPAKQYLDPHQEGEPSLGVDRPGYQRALQLGMRALREPAVAAATCTECHFITESRLISAGHPSGKGFDYPDGIQRIQHWEEASWDGAALSAAFRTALATRGPVPNVARARLATGPAAASGTGEAGGASVTASAGAPVTASAGAAASQGAVSTAGSGRQRPRRPAPPRPRPVDPRSVPVSGSATDLALPPFPELDTHTIEATLRALQQRLKELYTAVAAAEDNP